MRKAQASLSSLHIIGRQCKGRVWIGGLSKIKRFHESARYWNCNSADWSYHVFLQKARIFVIFIKHQKHKVSLRWIFLACLAAWNSMQADCIEIEQHKDNQHTLRSMLLAANRGTIRFAWRKTTFNWNKDLWPENGVSEASLRGHNDTILQRFTHRALHLCDPSVSIKAQLACIILASPTETFRLASFYLSHFKTELVNQLVRLQ